MIISEGIRTHTSTDRTVAHTLSSLSYLCIAGSRDVYAYVVYAQAVLAIQGARFFNTCYFPLQIAGCTLYYQDLVLEGALKPRTKLRLCNERWKVFSEFNKVATIRAEMLDGFAIPANEVSVLFRLREMLLLKSSANNMPSNLSDLHQLNCMDSDQISYISLPDFVYEWSVYCSESTKKATPMVVTRLRIGVVAHLSNGLPQDYLFTLTEEIGTLLLNLQHLELIYMVVFDGQLPPQLAGLRNMRSLSIEHYCLTGELPPGWMPNWKRLEDLAIVPRFASRPTYVDPSGGRCGVRGSIPASWTNTPSDVLVLALSYNNMDGQ